MSNRVAVKRYFAFGQIPTCWHVYDDGRYVYCGIDWLETLEYAQHYARNGVTA